MGTSRDFYMPNNRTTWPFMTAVHFLHHENSPTWAGDEPATLGADGQQQTNYATHVMSLMSLNVFAARHAQHGVVERLTTESARTHAQMG
ncbi:hypothetical protein TNCV_5115421 [Trichonephila clavipes]|nr:hypothetical protein TNCV_5115421 [Trichonephila clavipes]